MSNDPRKKIVISAINLTDAGPLSILRDCLNYASKELSGAYDIVALVCDKSLMGFDNIEYLEFPGSKRSWLARLYYEYVYFKDLSKKLKPHVWFSLHDVTPNVESEIRAVYCHNPGPFYNFSFREISMDYKVVFFNLFYMFFYMLNIRKNDFVVVQQDWLRKKFARLYRPEKIIVSHPSVDSAVFAGKPHENKERGKKYTFFYPVFPRVFKNMEVICEAAGILAAEGISDFEICLTIDGKENRYSRYIYGRYKALPNIKFLGWLTRETVYDYYQKTDCLVFPSKLETWGMPITEFKHFSKPMLLADLEYSHETIGRYDKVKFFDPDDPAELARFMKGAIKDNLIFDAARGEDVAAPFASSWKELFDMLLSKKGPAGCTQ